MGQLSIYNSSEAVVLILEVPKVQNTFDLMQQRKVDCNPPPKREGGARREGSSEPKMVSPHDSMKIFQMSA